MRLPKIVLKKNAQRYRTERDAAVRTSRDHPTVSQTTSQSNTPTPPPPHSLVPPLETPFTAPTTAIAPRGLSSSSSTAAAAHESRSALTDTAAAAEDGAYGLPPQQYALSRSGSSELNYSMVSSTLGRRPSDGSDDNDAGEDYEVGDSNQPHEYRSRSLTSASSNASGPQSSNFHPLQHQHDGGQTARVPHSALPASAQSRRPQPPQTRTQYSAYARKMKTSTRDYVQNSDNGGSVANPPSRKNSAVDFNGANEFFDKSDSSIAAEDSPLEQGDGGFGGVDRLYGDGGVDADDLYDTSRFQEPYHSGVPLGRRMTRHEVLQRRLQRELEGPKVAAGPSPQQPQQVPPKGAAAPTPAAPTTPTPAVSSNDRGPHHEECRRLISSPAAFAGLRKSTSPFQKLTSHTVVSPTASSRNGAASARPSTATTTQPSQHQQQSVTTAATTAAAAAASARTAPSRSLNANPSNSSSSKSTNLRHDTANKSNTSAPAGNPNDKSDGLLGWRRALGLSSRKPMTSAAAPVTAREVSPSKGKASTASAAAAAFTSTSPKTGDKGKTRKRVASASASPRHPNLARAEASPAAAAASSGPASAPRMAVTSSPTAWSAKTANSAAASPPVESAMPATSSTALRRGTPVRVISPSTEVVLLQELEKPISPEALREMDNLQLSRLDFKSQRARKKPRQTAPRSEADANRAGLGNSMSSFMNASSSSGGSNRSSSSTSNDEDNVSNSSMTSSSRRSFRHGNVDHRLHGQRSGYGSFIRGTSPSRDRRRSRSRQNDADGEANDNRSNGSSSSRRSRLSRHGSMPSQSPQPVNSFLQRLFRTSSATGGTTQGNAGNSGANGTQRLDRKGSKRNRHTHTHGSNSPQHSPEARVQHLSRSPGSQMDSATESSFFLPHGYANSHSSRGSESPQGDYYGKMPDYGVAHGTSTKGGRTGNVPRRVSRHAQERGRTPGSDSTSPHLQSLGSLFTISATNRHADDEEATTPGPKATTQTTPGAPQTAPANTPPSLFYSVVGGGDAAGPKENAGAGDTGGSPRTQWPSKQLPMADLFAKNSYPLATRVAAAAMTNPAATTTVSGTIGNAVSDADRATSPPNVFRESWQVSQQLHRRPEETAVGTASTSPSRRHHSAETRTQDSVSPAGLSSGEAAGDDADHMSGAIELSPLASDVASSRATYSASPVKVDTRLGSGVTPVDVAAVAPAQPSTMTSPAPDGGSPSTMSAVVHTEQPLRSMRGVIAQPIATTPALSSGRSASVNTLHAHDDDKDLASMAKAPLPQQQQQENAAVTVNDESEVRDMARKSSLLSATEGFTVRRRIGVPESASAALPKHDNDDSNHHVNSSPTKPSGEEIGRRKRNSPALPNGSKESGDAKAAHPPPGSPSAGSPRHGNKSQHRSSTEKAPRKPELTTAAGLAAAAVGGSSKTSHTSSSVAAPQPPRQTVPVLSSTESNNFRSKGTNNNVSKGTSGKDLRRSKGNSSRLQPRPSELTATQESDVLRPTRADSKDFLRRNGGANAASASSFSDRHQQHRHARGDAAGVERMAGHSRPHSRNPSMVSNNGTGVGATTAGAGRDGSLSFSSESFLDGQARGRMARAAAVVASSAERRRTDGDSANMLQQSRQFRCQHNHKVKLPRDANSASSSVASRHSYRHDSLGSATATSPLLSLQRRYYERDADQLAEGDVLQLSSGPRRRRRDRADLRDHSLLNSESASMVTDLHDLLPHSPRRGASASSSSLGRSSRTSSIGSSVRDVELVGRNSVRQLRKLAAKARDASNNSSLHEADLWDANAHRHSTAIPVLPDHGTSSTENLLGQRPPQQASHGDGNSSMQPSPLVVVPPTTAASALHGPSSSSSGTYTMKLPSFKRSAVADSSSSNGVSLDRPVNNSSGYRQQHLQPHQRPHQRTPSVLAHDGAFGAYTGSGNYLLPPTRNDHMSPSKSLTNNTKINAGAATTMDGVYSPMPPTKEKNHATVVGGPANGPAGLSTTASSSLMSNAETRKPMSGDDSDGGTGGNSSRFSEGIAMRSSASSALLAPQRDNTAKRRRPAAATFTPWSVDMSRFDKLKEEHGVAPPSTMRSSGGNNVNSRTPASDFVQDYAAKRQAQMERARQLRDERLHQQQQQQHPTDVSSGRSSPLSNTPMPLPSASSASTPKNEAPRPPPHVPRSRHPSSSHLAQSNAGPDAPVAADDRVLYVKEVDFKQATQAGIITPDQARQLWAMLSNQIIRVCPATSSSSQANAVSVNSLLALSNASSASSPTRRGSAGSNNNFGAGISLESLRTSIAYFKREQQRLKQQQGGGRGGATASSSYSPKPNGGGNAGTAAAARPPPSQPMFHDDDEDGEEASLMEEDEEADAYDRDELGGGNKNSAFSPPVSSSSSRYNRPAWNSDADIRYTDGATAPSSESAAAAARKKPRTGATEKANAAVRPSAGAKMPSARASPQQQQPGRPTVGAPNGRPSSTRDYDAEDSSDRGAYAAPPPKSQQFASPKATGAGRRPPARGGAAASPYSLATGGAVNVDDMPVGAASGGGGGGMNDWANAYPPGMAPPASAGIGGRAPASPAPLSVGGIGADPNDAIAAEAAAAAQEPMEECPTCGRTFRATVVARHAALCRKQTNKPRKVFNMRGQRLDGMEGIEEVKKTVGRTGGAASRGNEAASAAAATVKGKLPKWKVQHEQFQAAMRAVRQQEEGGGRGGFGTGQLAPPPAPVPEEYDDRVPCPHCGRKFAQDVAERHIPKCATTIAKPKGIRPIRR